MKVTTLGARLCAALLIASIAGCGARSGEPGGATTGSAPASQLVMTGALSGFAVWPSGGQWVLLATSDGWHSVQNRTPLAVPTDGGLVLAADADHVAVGVLPHELLTYSPVLGSVTAGKAWTPTQLSAALLGSSSSVARSEHATWAVLAGGELVTEPDGSRQWQQVTTPVMLDATGHFTVTGVAFPDGATGFVTGSGPAGRPVLFQSTDLGRSWHAASVSLDGEGTATSLAPCRVGTTWVAPVFSGGRLRVFTASDAHGPWTAGSPLPMSSLPAVACGPDRVWAAVPEAGGDSDVLFVQAPGGPWTDQGTLPSRVASLAVASADQGFAATAEADAVLSVTLGHGPLTAWLALPNWVASLGSGSTGD